MKGMLKYLVLAGLLVGMNGLARYNKKAMAPAPMAIEAVEMETGLMPAGAACCEDCPNLPAPCLEPGEKTCRVQTCHPGTCFTISKKVETSQPYRIAPHNSCVECRGGQCFPCGSCPKPACPCPERCPRPCCRR